MTLSRLRSLALSSIATLLLVAKAPAATRPRYGGTLRMEVPAQLRSLDPVADNAGQITPLLFDTLVTADASGHLQPSLAVTWNQENDRRCRFTLRREVKFSDGSRLTAAVAAASLRHANPDWTVRELGDEVVAEADQPSPDFCTEAALTRNAIVLRAGDALLGTGAFTVAEWQAGARATLQARDDGWHPRPFVDRIDVQFNRGLREQSVDLELGRADLVEVAPEDGRQSARRIARSDPVVLLALRFSHTNPAVRDARIREAVSLAIDRESIANILLQRRGEAAGGLLPNWMTGYSFLFETRPQVARARQLRAAAGGSAPMTLVYHAADPLARLVAERVALNAGDAGLTVRTAPDTQDIAVPDIELVAIRLPSSEPLSSLAALSRTGVLALPYVAPATDAPEAIYRATLAALKDTWAAPIAYAPLAFGLGPRVANWTMSHTGDWHLDDVSVSPAEGPRP